jgi:hypothetical protein
MAPPPPTKKAPSRGFKTWEERLWRKDFGGKTLEERLWRKDFGGKTLEERLWRSLLIIYFSGPIS